MVMVRSTPSEKGRCSQSIENIGAGRLPLLRQAGRQRDT
jgi:hypothetical protein